MADQNAGGNAAANDNMAELRIDAVALRLPPFWMTNVNGWFCRVEACFAARGITRDSTMLNHLLSALDERTMSQLNNVLATLPTDGGYKALKDAMVAPFDLTEDQRIQLLISMPPSDRTPSE